MGGQIEILLVVINRLVGIIKDLLEVYLIPASREIRFTLRSSFHQSV